MARVKLDLPQEFNFSTEIPVRVSDINYGGHVGNDSILSLVHEARVRFLKEYGFTEADVGGPRLIISDAIIVYKSQSFYGDTFIIEVAVGDISGHSCDILYRITQQTTGKEVARAKTGIVFYDYEKGKVADTPLRFKETFSIPQS